MKDERKFEIEKSILDGTKEPKDYMNKRSEYLYALEFRKNMNNKPENETKQPENSNENMKDESKTEPENNQPENETEKKEPETEKIKELNNDFVRTNEPETDRDKQLQEKLKNAFNTKEKQLTDLNKPENESNNKNSNSNNNKSKNKKNTENDDLNNEAGAKMIIDAIAEFEGKHHLPQMNETKQKRMTSNLSVVFDRYLPENIGHYLPEFMLGVDSITEITDIAEYIHKNPHPNFKTENSNNQNQNTNNENRKPENETKQPENRQPEPPKRNNEPNINGWNVNELKEAIARGGGNPDVLSMR